MIHYLRQLSKRMQVGGSCNINVGVTIVLNLSLSLGQLFISLPVFQHCQRLFSPESAHVHPFHRHRGPTRVDIEMMDKAITKIGCVSGSLNMETGINPNDLLENFELFRCQYTIERTWYSRQL